MWLPSFILQGVSFFVIHKHWNTSNWPARRVVRNVLMMLPMWNLLLSLEYPFSAESTFFFFYTRADVFSHTWARQSCDFLDLDSYLWSGKSHQVMFNVCFCPHIECCRYGCQGVPGVLERGFAHKGTNWFCKHDIICVLQTQYQGPVSLKTQDMFHQHICLSF